MGSTKHEKSFVDYDKGYEQNIIGLRGIVYFMVGLTLLIVVTFVLMLLLMNVMEDQAVKDKDVISPMRQEVVTDRDRFLPPEPRLQAAPGFGVEGPNGRIDLQLKAPQSEWWQLEKQWKQELENGQRHPQTGTVITLPIEEAKRRLLEQNIKARPTEPGRNPLEESRTFYSYPSAGRLQADKQR